VDLKYVLSEVETDGCKHGGRSWVGICALGIRPNEEGASIPLTSRGSSPPRSASVTSKRSHVMPRKPRPSHSTSREKCDINPATGLPWRFRVPREMRIVSASRVRTSARGTCEQIVPQIRLRGAWLAQLGFTQGAYFLVLADTPKQIILTILNP
jgi:hypothetical protein